MNNPVETVSLPDGCRVPVTDNYQTKHATSAGKLDYDTRFMDRIRPMIPKNGFVVDAGACIGVYTKFFSDAVGAGGFVLAMEPCEQNFSILEHNVSCFPIKNVLLSKRALAHRDGFGTWSYKTTNIGESFVELSVGDISDHDILFTTLDMFVPRATSRKIDFLKLDIEGFEFFAIIGGFQLIRHTKPPMIIEINPACLARLGVTDKMIYVLVDQLGYDWTIYQTEHIPEGGHFDIICTPRPPESKSSHPCIIDLELP